MVWTHTQPTMGMANWKKPNTDERPMIWRLGMSGCRRPLATDTEKASMASPTPSRMLLKKNAKSCSIGFTLSPRKSKARHSQQAGRLRQKKRDFPGGAAMLTRPVSLAIESKPDRQRPVSMLTCYARRAYRAADAYYSLTGS